MGIVFASTGPVNLLVLPILFQSCVGIRTPYHRTCRANVLNVCNEQECSLLLLYDSSGKSSFTSSTGDSSSTTSTTSCAGSDGPVDVLITPCGTGITVSPFLDVSKNLLG